MRPLLAPTDAGGPQGLDHLPVVRLREELDDRLGHLGPDVRHELQRLLVGVHQPVQVAEKAREVLRRRLADVGNAERVDEARQRRPLAPLDRADEVACRELGHALQAGQRRLVQPVQVRCGLHQTAVHKLVHQLVAQAVDVQGAAACEVEDRLLALRGAEQAAAAPRHRLPRRADDARPADRARRGHDEFSRVLRAPVRHHAHHLRDDVPGAAHDDGVADAHVLAPHLVLVVERRVRHGHAAHEHRLEARHRRHGAGPPHLDVDAEQLGRHFLGRELVRHGEARGARDEPQPFLPAQIVHLVHHAVDVVGQRIAPGADPPVVRQ